MNVTNNECPAGLVKPPMRRAYPVPVDRISNGRATCHLCGHPGLRVLYEGETAHYQWHKESSKVGGFTESGRSYSKRRTQTW